MKTSFNFNRMRIVLIGNYKKDKQQSMQRFAEMLLSGFEKNNIQSEIWYPVILLGLPFSTTNSGIEKWIGYLDKWILFPLYLQIKLFFYELKYKNVHYHICDHSNSPYLSWLPINKTSITCHDVLPIRAALGYKDSYVTVSTTGAFLQKWILKHLKKSLLLGAVSNYTLIQLKQLISPEDQVKKNEWRVIHNAFNRKFSKMDNKSSNEILLKVGISNGCKFILHVGSDELRKNRGLLIDMVHILGESWKGNICFAGRPVESRLMSQAIKLGLQNRIISIVNPCHDLLQALYSRCDAFIFPSFSEGFGWPLIEAQACGAPVIASSISPIIEVTGLAAIHCDPSKASDFASAFLTLKDIVFRKKIIKRGLDNCLRFDNSKMINDYLKLYTLI